jgi:MFS family permease
MLRRFSLYGFLKNQQYYDYFLLLAFLQMGLSYFVIGVLISFREILVGIMEIPSGGVADLWGRRNAMIFSFSAYIISFALFGVCGIAATEYHLTNHFLVPLLLLAMVFFSVGEAFRTGTHKALIFTWLRIQARTAEGTKVYGYTRSWSKIGSAVSVIVACIIVFVTSNFIYVFFFAIIPYAVNIINFLGYPKEIDCCSIQKVTLKDMLHHLKGTLKIVAKRASLRRLVLESMGFEGFFKASKDYLQPILMGAALPLTTALFAGIQLSDEQRSVVLIGPVYAALFILSAIASRNAHRLVPEPGQEAKTARNLWGVGVCITLVIGPALYFQVHWIMITCFATLHIVQNFWRPVLISRFNAHSDEGKGATILSVESQAKSLSTTILAPVLGLAIDQAKNRSIGESEFWPIGIVGLAITLGFFLTARVKDNKGSSTPARS